MNTISLTQQELQVLLSIANRAPQTPSDQYVIAVIVAKANEQIQQAQQAQENHS